MKQIVLTDSSNSVSITDCHQLAIAGKHIYAGRVDESADTFDPMSPDNQWRVWVEKIGFSCNYRDRSWLFPSGEEEAPAYWGIGSDFVARVLVVGSAVSHLKPGDRVIPNSCYPAEYEGTEFGIPSNHSSLRKEAIHGLKLMKIPESMPDEVAAAFTVGAQTSWSMVRRMHIEAHDNVLVTAATSNTSLFILEALKASQAAVFALTGSADAVEKISGKGAEEVILIDRDQPLLKNQHLLKVLESIGGFTAVFDPFWDVYLKKVAEVMQFNGRYITCGSAGIGMETAQIYASMHDYVYKNLQLNGNCLGSTEDLEHAIDAYQRGEMEVTIDTVFRGDQVAEFFERTFNSRDRLGKVVYMYE